MIKQLKWRSTVIFSVLNISVLFLVLGLAFIISIKQVEESAIVLAKRNVSNFINTIFSTGEIRKQELVTLLDETYLHLYIEDNHTPLFLSNNFSQEVIKECKAIAVSKGLSSENPLESSISVLDFLFSLEKENDSRVIVQQALGKNNEWITAIGFQNRTVENQKKKSLITTYSIIAALSALLFVFISRLLAGISAKPTAESLQRQSDFIAAASHEIRTPLAVIKANLAVMEIKPDKNEYYSHIINNEVNQLARLAEDLTNLTFHDNDRWALQKKIVNLDTFILNLYEAYLPLVSERDQKLQLSLPEKTFPVVSVDEERLQQVFSILLNNAMTYTKKGTVITLGGQYDEKRLLLFVSDNGEGISKVEASKIFQPFYQVEASRSNKNHFGLGLSIAKEITQLHGGTLRYQDTKGGGATFVFTLPC